MVKKIKIKSIGELKDITDAVCHLDENVVVRGFASGATRPVCRHYKENSCYYDLDFDHLRENFSFKERQEDHACACVYHVNK